MRNIIFLTTGALIVILFASCKNDNKVILPRTDIHLDSNLQVGNHIVDKDGRTLYFFSNDVNGGLSNCTGGCLTTFPIFNADPVTTTFSDGLLATDFKTIILT